MLDCQLENDVIVSVSCSTHCFGGRNDVMIVTDGMYALAWAEDRRTDRIRQRIDCT